jgi:DNA-binding MarR family transcriptional regulator
MHHSKKSSSGTNSGSKRKTSAHHLDIDNHLSFLIVSLANKITTSASVTYMRHFGIGVMEWRVLAMVAANPGVTAKDISQVSGVDKSVVSRASHILIERGLLATTNDISDNRRTLHVLTSAGHVLHDRIYAASMARRRLLTTGLSATERMRIIGYCRRLIDNIPLLINYQPADAPPLRTAASQKRAPRAKHV